MTDILASIVGGILASFSSDLYRKIKEFIRKKPKGEVQ